MNLISSEERTAYETAIDDVHETMSRSITVWKKSAQIIVSQNENFDAFSDQGSSQITYTTESEEFQARIKYIDRQEKEFELIAGNSNTANSRINMTQEFQLVRIKVDAEAKNYIKDAEKVTIDGLDFTPVTIQRPHGVFSPKYFTIYLSSYP